jgi:hypothetical protein
MTTDRTLNELRKKAHEFNCNLAEADYDPREIEIIGYYLTRIAASYLSYFTHKEIGESEETGKITKSIIK